MTTIDARSSSPSREPWLHAVARESRAFLRGVVIVLLLATAVTMIAFPFWGIFPAILLLLAYAFLWLANIAEHRSRTGWHIAAREEPELSGVDADEAEGEQEAAAGHHETPAAMEEIPMSTLLKESITGAEIVVGVAVASVIVAAMLFHWTLIIVALLFLFPYMIILLAPVWLGWFSRELQDEDLKRKEREHLQAQG